jgi:HEAT repeat protein
MKELGSRDQGRVLACLDMLVAWERAVPVPDLRFLIEGTDRRIRIQALRLAPLVPLENADLNAIIRVLLSDDAEAAAAAAMAVGRLRFAEALPELARCVRANVPALARAAAEALAHMPPKGWTTLEELGASPNPLTAGAAVEALALARRKARVI